MLLAEDLIADASFYICFLDCIKESDCLIRILDNFNTHIPPKISKEISISNNWSKISGHKNLNHFDIPPFDIGKVIQPFLSERELEKGEYDIIITAYFFYNLFKLKEFILVIDDLKPRKFIQVNLTQLYPHLMGTVNFIKSCCLEYKIFNKQETLELYTKIGKSNFRIKPEILEKLKEEICQK
jgi:hypothetical protein